MWHYALSRILRNLNFDIDIGRNQGSEELLKLGGGQKIFIFRGGGSLWGGVQKIFIFSGGLPYEGYLGGSSYSSAYYDFEAWSYK